MSGSPARSWPPSAWQRRMRHERNLGDLDPYEMGVVRLVFMAPWLLLVLAFIPGPPRPDLLRQHDGPLPFELAARALHEGHQGFAPVAHPALLAFTPRFIIRRVLPETHHPAGLLHPLHRRRCLPRTSHAREGVRFQGHLQGKCPAHARRIPHLLLTGVLGKIAVLHSDPYFFGVAYHRPSPCSCSLPCLS